MGLQTKHEENTSLCKVRKKSSYTDWPQEKKMIQFWKVYLVCDFN